MDQCVSCCETHGDHKPGCEKETKRLTNRLNTRKRQLKHARRDQNMARITELMGPADKEKSVAYAERELYRHKHRITQGGEGAMSIPLNQPMAVE